MLSVPVQFVAWEDRLRNDLLYVEGDVKHLVTHSLIVNCSFLPPPSLSTAVLNLLVCDVTPKLAFNLFWFLGDPL